MALEWTGERFVPGKGGVEIAYEHFPRYLLASTLATGLRVLDLGCGAGYGAQLLSRSASSVLGVDPAAEAIEHAAARYGAPNLRFRLGTAATLRATDDGPFDLVACFEVLEHIGLEDQRSLLADVASLLSPTGILLVSTPQRSVYHEESGPGFVNEFHVREMDFAELRDLLAERFAASSWWGQLPLSGSLLRRLNGDGPAAPTEWNLKVMELAGDGLSPSSSPSPAQAKYLIAACAHEAQTLARLVAPEGLVFVDAAGTLERERGAMARWAMTLEPERRAFERATERAEVERREAAGRLEAARASEERERAAARELLRRVEEAEGEAAAAREAMLQFQRSKLWKLGTVYWTLRDPKQAREALALGVERVSRFVRRRLGRPLRSWAAGQSAALQPEPVDQREPVSARALRAVAARCRAAGHANPSFLDWRSGLELAARLPEELVFSPWSTADALPYLDGSIEVVALRATDVDHLSEARRIAAAAVLLATEGGRVTIEWLQERGQALPPTISVVIPVFNHAQLTEVCLEAIEATLPAGWQVQVVVVDDASTDTTPAVLAAWEERVPWLHRLRNDTNLGFVDSCNRGAEAASGELLVFLNNDTRAQPGWLEALTETFRTHPEAGAVGGKLIYADGRLQEAGGAIFSDGSGFNIGRNEPDSNAPLYSFMREVDYCSGALLATRTELFRELGGFDRRYRPAYYEDTDYCFAIRARGLKVLYQPDAATVHLEGATGGTDLAAGVKSHQVANREIFRQKWQDQLAQRPGPPPDAGYSSMHALVGPRAARRALVMSHTLPEFDIEGGSRRIFHLVQFLVEAGWMVSFMAPWVPHGERYERILRQLGVATYRKGLKELGEGLWRTEADRLIATGKLDLALIGFWHVAEDWAPVVRRLSPETRVVVDSVDLHFLRNARRAFLLSHQDPGTGLGLRFGEEMRRELNQYHAADAVLTVSDREAVMVNDVLGRENAFAVPDCEEVPTGEVPFGERRGAVFLGNMRHPPNGEAVQWLCKRIWPELDPALLAEHPIRIVGAGVDERLARLSAGRPGIEVVGWVPSPTPYLQRARLSILPLLHGAGTKRKLLQAALAGTPSVSTPVGAEGFGLTHGEDVLVASEPRAFAMEMTRLLTDEGLWTRLAETARRDLAARHSPEGSRRRFFEVIDAVTERRP